MNTTPTPVTLHNDQTVELAGLLGQLEDWLLHTDELVIADLDRFLAGTWRGPATACYLIDALGEFSVLLGRHAHEGQEGQDRL
jgi:hypothetical protein